MQVDDKKCWLPVSANKLFREPWLGIIVHFGSTRTTYSMHYCRHAHERCNSDVQLVVDRRRQCWYGTWTAYAVKISQPQALLPMQKMDTKLMIVIPDEWCRTLAHWHTCLHTCSMCVSSRRLTLLKWVSVATMVQPQRRRTSLHALRVPTMMHPRFNPLGMRADHGSSSHSSTPVLHLQLHLLSQFASLCAAHACSRRLDRPDGVDSNPAPLAQVDALFTTTRQRFLNLGGDGGACHTFSSTNRPILCKSSGADKQPGIISWEKPSWKMCLHEEEIEQSLPVSPPAHIAPSSFAA